MSAALVCRKRPVSHFEEISLAKRICTSSSWLSPPPSSDFDNPFQPSSSNNGENIGVSASCAKPLDENLNCVASSSGSGADFYPHPKRLRSISQFSPPKSIDGYNPFSQAQAQAPSKINLPVEDQEWADAVVNEMKNASNMDDARARALSVLHNYKNYILSPQEAARNDLQKANTVLKEQKEALNEENSILKRAVVILHERQKESDSISQELQHQKQLVNQLKLEIYALTLRLRQAEQSSLMPSHFHPHVY